MALSESGAPKVGIPRALEYYQHFPFWKVFFEGLGAEVVVSPPTTKAVLASGSARLVAETCLPTKVFCGHVIALCGRTDYVFIPSVRSIERDVYNCSKFLGLPDLVRNAVPESPPILDIEIDVNKGEKTVRREIHKLASVFTRNPLRVNKAYQKALDAEREFKRCLAEGTGLEEALAKFDQVDAARSSHKRPSQAWLGVEDRHEGLVIAVVGHPYNIYDAYINQNLIARLERLGAKVVTAEMAPEGGLDEGTAKLVGRPYWTYEDEFVGAAGYYLDSDVDGVLAVVCFGCGPDSMMLDVVQRAAKQRRRLPFSVIVIDEHTGEAGLVTRLEAFVDMLDRKRRLERSKLSDSAALLRGV